MPQKKNFRRVPKHIAESVSRLTENCCKVAIAEEVSAASIEAGVFTPFGLSISNGVIKTEGPVVPSVKSGKYSKRNAEGREVIRRDLPKVSKEVYLGDRPIYGDWSNGSFTLWQTRMVYVREFEGPRGFRIGVEVLETGERSGETFCVILFSVIPSLDKTSSGFDDDLLYQLNILQENVGGVGVFAHDASKEELLDEIRVEWKILPPGSSDHLLRVFRGRGRTVNEEMLKRFVERRDYLESLGPENFVIGFGGSDRYFGALFADDLVVFENMDYGNAIYIMSDDWKVLSQLTRTELLNRSDVKFERVIHREGWQNVVEAIIRKRTGFRRRRRLWS